MPANDADVDLLIRIDSRVAGLACFDRTGRLVRLFAAALRRLDIAKMTNLLPLRAVLISALEVHKYFAFDVLKAVLRGYAVVGTVAIARFDEFLASLQQRLDKTVAAGVVAVLGVEIQLRDLLLAEARLYVDCFLA
jgi:hypothetical protein